MYTIYNKSIGHNLTRISSTPFSYVLGRHTDNLAKVVGYYRNASNAVASNHLLVNILKTLPTGRGMNLGHYRYLIDDMSDEIASNFNLASSTNYGKGISPGTFLGEGTEEIIILLNEPFSIESLKNGWRDAQPLRFIKHPKISLGLDLPDGSDQGGENGSAVILLNLPLLACQYKLWRDSVSDMEYRETTMQYVHKFILPNMLESFLSVSLINILYRLFIGKSITDTDDNHPFYINRFFNKTVDGLTDLLSTQLNKRQSFYKLLETTELINKRTFRETIAIPRTSLTRQVIWSLTLARLELIDFLITWNNRSSGNDDREELRTVRVSLRRILSDKNNSKIFSNDLKNEVETFIKDELLANL